VIDDQIAGHLGVYFLGVAAQAFHGGAEGGQIDYAGDAGEILEDYPPGLEGQLGLFWSLGVPLGQLVDVLGGYLKTVYVAQQAFQEDLDGEGQAIDPADGLVMEFAEPVYAYRSGFGLQVEFGSEWILVW
jgi:hypothetical protein